MVVVTRPNPKKSAEGAPVHIMPEWLTTTVASVLPTPSAGARPAVAGRVASAGRRRAARDLLGDPHRRQLRARRRRGHRLPAGGGRSGRGALRSRHPPGHVPAPPLDDAPVRRLLERRRVQPALSLPPGPWHHRPVGGLRPPDPDRLRLGPPAGPRRS